jgi:serine/threonine protein kinase
VKRAALAVTVEMAAEGSSSRVTRRQSSATVCAEFNYRLGKTMGFGAFSKVKSATHSLTGQKVAIKIMNRHKMKDMEDKGIYPSFLWDDDTLKVMTTLKSYCVCFGLAGIDAMLTFNMLLWSFLCSILIDM